MIVMTIYVLIEIVYVFLALGAVAESINNDRRALTRCRNTLYFYLVEQKPRLKAFLFSLNSVSY